MDNGYEALKQHHADHHSGKVEPGHCWYPLAVRCDDLRAERNACRSTLAAAARALIRTGIIGIYAEFTDLADAIDQMGSYGKELEARRDALQGRLKLAEEMAHELRAVEEHDSRRSASLAAWRAEDPQNDEEG